MRDLDIGEVSKRTGLSASTLRFYEKKGLITPMARHGLRRQYAAGVLDRLALIALGRAAGLSLDEIGSMLASDGWPHIDRQKLMSRADELDTLIHQLTLMRDGLRRAAECPATDHGECPTFRRLMKAAARGYIAPRKGISSLF